MTEPLITKQAVAQRQINAAIRMLFLYDEDMCAVHTVAAAGLAVIEALAEAKGIGKTYETRAAVESFLKERYNLDPSAPEVAREIELRTKAIENGSIGKATRLHRNRIANFLKHADKDADHALDSIWFSSEGGWFVATDSSPALGGTGTLEVISMAVYFYNRLNLPITTEMEIYARWWVGTHPENHEQFIRTKSGPIHLFTFEQQRDFGRYMLEFAYKSDR